MHQMKDLLLGQKISQIKHAKNCTMLIVLNILLLIFQNESLINGQYKDLFKTQGNKKNMLGGQDVFSMVQILETPLMSSVIVIFWTIAVHQKTCNSVVSLAVSNSLLSVYYTPTGLYNKGGNTCKRQNREDNGDWSTI